MVDLSVSPAYDGRSFISGKVALPFTINVREIEGVTVLDLSGELIWGEACDTLRERMEQLLAAKRKKILINLKNLGKLDSSGLGALIGLPASVREHGVQLRMVSSTPIHDCFPCLSEMVRNIMHMYSDEDAALASFQ